VARPLSVIFDAPVGLAALSGAVLMIGATAIFLATSLRLASFTAFALSAYLLAVAEVVGLAEVLTPFHAITQSWYLAGSAIAAGLAGVAWQACGRPRPPTLPVALLRELRDYPAVCLLGLIVLLALAYELSVGLTTAPNNWDSLWHHLVRVAGWRQRDAVEYIGGLQGDLGVNAYPPNAELQVLFGFVVYGRDTFATVPQFLAQGALLISIFGIARRLGFDFVPSIFAALLSATLSIVALESVTTQNDLSVAALVTSAIFFALGDRRTDFALSGLAIGLALGTKVTAILAVPVIVVIALAAGGKRRLVSISVSATVGFAFFGAFVFALNLINTGKLFGDPAEQNVLRSHVSAVGILSTAVRSVYRFADLSGLEYLVESNLGSILVLVGLPGLAAAAATIAHSRGWRRGNSWAEGVVLAAFAPLALVLLSGAARELLLTLHTPLNPPGASANRFIFTVNSRANEDSSYFGPLGALLVWPLSVMGCIAWARGRVDRRIGALATALPIYLLMLAATIRYTNFIGRYFIIPVAAVMPLAALVCRNRMMMAATAALGMIFLPLSLLFNEIKPVGLGNSPAIWTLPRAEQQALMRPRMEPILERVRAEVPHDAHLGVVINSRDWSYPFYGADLGRTVTYLPQSPSTVEANALCLTWLIVHRRQMHAEEWAWDLRRIPRTAAARQGCV
jgi:hypothetical protein